MIGWKNRLRTDHIVIHSSGTHPDQKDTEGHPIDFKYLDKKHRSAGAFSCGYHWVIERDGVAVSLRPGDAHGNHCPGENAVSVAICLIGGKDVEGNPASNFTKAQWVSLHQLVDALTRKYPEAEVVGHRDVSPKATTCPSFDVRHWVADTKYQNKEDTNARDQQSQQTGSGTPAVS